EFNAAVAEFPFDVIMHQVEIQTHAESRQATRGQSDDLAVVLRFTLFKNREYVFAAIFVALLAIGFVDDGPDAEARGAADAGRGESFSSSSFRSRCCRCRARPRDSRESRGVQCASVWTAWNG
ncbi:MAG: hypothetical protein RIF32_08915, partial [Leptospirales bacterium]